jgi:hypothetical protein
MISNTRILRTILGGLLLASLTRADVVTMDGGSSVLSGTVRSIDADGNVKLATDLTPEPLLLKGESVDRIEFSQTKAPADAATSLIELANGDIMPGSVESLIGDQLAIRSPDAGGLIIHRDKLRSIQAGINPRRVLYDGPNGPGDWTSPDSNSNRLSFQDKAMLASGPTSASKDLEPTRQFILRFDLVWEQNRAPNFKVYFADPGTDHNEADDRYYLQFGPAGLEIKREAAKGKRYNTLLILNRSYATYADNRLNVELRVNRDSTRIGLLLNGESEGEIADPIPMTPKGNGLAVVFNHSENTVQEIRNIVVLEYDDTRHRHRAEDRGDGSSDKLITRDDSRWSGTLQAIRKTGNELTYVFKSRNQEEFMEIPEQDISTIFLAGNDKPATPPAASPFVLRLHPEGSLSVDSCVFNPEGVSANHPLLGRITLHPGSITAIERIKPAAPEEP